MAAGVVRREPLWPTPPPPSRPGLAQELDLVEADAVVYKLVGPVLVKTALSDAKATVKGRMDFIEGDLKRMETLIATKEKESEELRLKILQKQQQVQKEELAEKAKKGEA